MKFAQFLNEVYLTEAVTLEPSFASAVLLYLYNGKDLVAFGNREEYSHKVSIKDPTLKKKLALIANAKAPRGITSITFEDLASKVLGKVVNLDDTIVYVDEKKVGSVKVDASWADLIDAIPGLRAKLKEFHKGIENESLAKSLEI